ncbi:hypothetical protein [Sporolactobacillus laevolacticus]
MRDWIEYYNTPRIKKNSVV